jgi:hypothetical protein
MLPGVRVMLASATLGAVASIACEGTPETPPARSLPAVAGLEHPSLTSAT